MSEEKHEQKPPQADDAQPEATEPPEGAVVPENGQQGKTDNEKLDDAALKFVADAAYAVAGFAGLVGEKAKAFYDEQRAEYAKTHPDVESPGAREFLEQLGSHLDRFVDEISRGFRDLSDKGREVVNSTRPAKPGDAAKPEEPVGNPQAGDAPTKEPTATEPEGEEYGEEYRNPGGN